MVERLQYTCFNWRSDLIFFKISLAFFLAIFKIVPWGRPPITLHVWELPSHRASIPSELFFLWDFMIRVHDILHDMETFSAPLALWEGNSPVTSGFSSQKTNKAKVCCSLWCWLVQAVKQAITWLGIHKQDNICSSSMYGLCVIYHWVGQDAPRPSKRGWYSGTFSQMNGPGVVNSTWTKSKLTVWSTNLV